jgi:hypothetical protein
MVLEVPESIAPKYSPPNIAHIYGLGEVIRLNKGDGTVSSRIVGCGCIQTTIVEMVLLELNIPYVLHVLQDLKPKWLLEKLNEAGATPLAYYQGKYIQNKDVLAMDIVRGLLDQFQGSSFSAKKSWNKLKKLTHEEEEIGAILPGNVQYAHKTVDISEFMNRQSILDNTLTAIECAQIGWEMLAFEPADEGSLNWFRDRLKNANNDGGHSVKWNDNERDSISDDVTSTGGSEYGKTPSRRSVTSSKSTDSFEDEFENGSVDGKSTIHDDPDAEALFVSLEGAQLPNKFRPSLDPVLEKKRKKGFAKALRNAVARYEPLENLLAEFDFVCGDEPGLDDFIRYTLMQQVFVIVASIWEYDTEFFKQCPNIKEWMDRLRDRESNPFKKLYNYGEYLRAFGTSFRAQLPNRYFGNELFGQGLSSLATKDGDKRKEKKKVTMKRSKRKTTTSVSSHICV